MQLLPYLNSLCVWQDFMLVSEAKSKAQIHLQLRVRALLFDKASSSLYLRSPPVHASSLHPSYLQLHADDIYYSLEEDADDWTQLKAEGSLTLESLQKKGPDSNFKRSFSSSQSSEQVVEGTSCIGSKFAEADVENLSSRSKNGEIPEIWYSQWREKHLLDRMQRLSWRLSQQQLPFGDRETYKRTPEGMSAYLSFSQNHKKKRQVIELNIESRPTDSFIENGPNVQADLTAGTDCSTDEEISFFPETMFPSNCVPDSAIPATNKEAENPKIEFCGIFDNLPLGVSRSPLLIERFGMGSEYLNLGVNTGKNRAAGRKKVLSEQEAVQITKQAVVRIVAGAGFEGLKEGSMDVISQLLSCHISKLGRILRVLADSFRKQYSQMELLRMFLQTIGYSNLGTLMDYSKAGTRLSPQQTHQQLVRTTQPQQQTVLPHAQQIQRQLSQQILSQQQILSINLSIQQQQQLEKARRGKPLTPRSCGRKPEKDRIVGDIKIENTNDSAIDCKVAAPLVSQHHAQWQQQQSILGSHHPQPLPPYKQVPSLQLPQLPQIQQQGLFSRDTAQIRPPPVKVEGFEELMGSPLSNVKQEPEDEISRTLISPRK